MALHRRSPRSLSLALGPLQDSVAPSTVLAQVQAAWPAIVGDVIARETEVVSERAGAVTVACSSAVWAQELNLISADIVGRLNRHLGGPRVQSLRPRAAGLPQR